MRRFGGFERSADWKSAIQQIGNLRYGSKSSAIGFCEQRDGVDDPQVQGLKFRAVDELEEAAWVAVGDDAGAGGLDVFELAVEELVGHFRLHDVVDASAAAAPEALRQLYQLEVGDEPQELAWLGGDLLAMREVAGLVVGHDLDGKSARW